VPADLLAFGLAAALAAEPAAPADVPPVALLEFIGLWTTDDGKWIDPEVLDALPEPDRKAAGPPPAPPKAPEDPAAQGGAASGAGDVHEDVHE